jgi:hypothetical protein
MGFTPSGFRRGVFARKTYVNMINMAAERENGQANTNTLASNAWIGIRHDAGPHRDISTIFAYQVPALRAIRPFASPAICRSHQRQRQRHPARCK